MDNKNISWENTISVHNIKSFNAGVDSVTVGVWVKSLTNFKYFCFNGVVFEPFSGYVEDTGYRLDYETRLFYKKNP